MSWAELGTNQLEHWHLEALIILISTIIMQGPIIVSVLIYFSYLNIYTVLVTLKTRKSMASMYGAILTYFIFLGLKALNAK